MGGPNVIGPLTPTFDLVSSLPVFALFFKVLTTTKAFYLYKLISVQPPRNTRSSSSVIISRPSSSSSLKITNR